jgi:signal transduction histidine kinase
MPGELQSLVSGVVSRASFISDSELHDAVPAHVSKIRHDINHELATIMLLAELVRSSLDAGTDSRTRVRQLLHEARWLDELLRIHDDVVARESIIDEVPAASVVRIDVIAGEVLAALRMTHTVQVRLRTVQACTLANPVALWRAIRNVVQNAFQAAGHNGRVEVTVALESGDVVAQIDDDGPGFDDGPRSSASLGLGIVQDFAVDRGGVVEIRRSRLGGSCVRLILPAFQSGPAFQDDTASDSTRF